MGLFEKNTVATVLMKTTIYVFFFVEKNKNAKLITYCAVEKKNAKGSKEGNGRKR